MATVGWLGLWGSFRGGTWDCAPPMFLLEPTSALDGGLEYPALHLHPTVAVLDTTSCLLQPNPGYFGELNALSLPPREPRRSNYLYKDRFHPRNPSAIFTGRIH
ncbi:hypothetical protein GGTG_07281 [Gaeumannomyces tritici R3-111a-1]|uniref:Uncharacterized protein n=1 Tax=Gaeumannomyces tritici (strain R3-111a-1) TaxID=644352 RepID=J3P184_GAET3|nr:hypothetical protein GGTG_07281 [Gaeumannomyces tritici R3-111a-1]EJT77369.1 hypothetical protein GGTG_07281 [Gaeumannomyces tritici R3-111a-1]